MDPSELPHHGATDSGEPPRFDFSSNAHPLGPCPAVLETIRSHDPAIYPDPSYADLRAQLARHHGVDPEQVVVGAGAAELVHRIVRHRAGTVSFRTPGFGEYAHAARCAGLAASSRRSLDEAVVEGSVVFACLPNNPDGFCPSSEDLSRFAARCREAGSLLVLDLAYLPFLETPPALPPDAVRLFAPNKSMGLVGVRAGYLLAPDRATGRSLSASAPSWVIGTESVAFLRACIHELALEWLAATAPQARSLRAELARILRAHGFEVVESAATHLVARHHAWPDSGILSSRFRRAGIRVRDTASMGLPGWIRLAARPEPELSALDDALGILVR